jgi:hypothetical protein
MGEVCGADAAAGVWGRPPPWVRLAAETVRVTIDVPLKLTEPGETEHPIALAEGVHERSTAPLNPKTEARLMDMAVEDLSCTANWGTTGVIVKSGVAGITTERGTGELVDSRYALSPV